MQGISCPIAGHDHPLNVCFDNLGDRGFDGHQREVSKQRQRLFFVGKGSFLQFPDPPLHSLRGGTRDGAYPTIHVSSFSERSFPVLCAPRGRSLGWLSLYIPSDAYSTLSLRTKETGT